ncbi:hypothetical protein SDC9_115338 [bioreactor metagenome]|uniref:Uncharacterized protein n=1 Tax=bioreactor metagenome TaxID=1076179 RepID=A0A645BSQ5_9ZZZZ
MKTFFAVCCLLLTFCQTTFAMLGISDQMIGGAQEYGRSKVALPVNELQKPWTVNEALKENIYADSERIIVYTPYLIVAMDAQNKAKAFEEIKLEDSRNLASGYEQALVIGAIIDAPEKTIPENLQVAILQGDKNLPPYYGELVTASSSEKVIEKTAVQDKNNNGMKPVEDKTPIASDKEKTEQASLTDKINIKMPVWNIQYYFYFDVSQINTTLPLIIKIDDKLAGEREFRFHLGNMN